MGVTEVNGQGTGLNVHVTSQDSQNIDPDRSQPRNTAGMKGSEKTPCVTGVKRTVSVSFKKTTSKQSNTQKCNTVRFCRWRKQTGRNVQDWIFSAGIKKDQHVHRDTSPPRGGGAPHIHVLHEYVVQRIHIWTALARKAAAVLA